ncbi:MAG: translational GTPase TypA [Planctomycetota bacterium]|nr:translational GTPase TypA [Planctomycetota bacterium]
MTETTKIKPIDTIRNIAVIAHVDHGKTTLVDKLLKATDSIPSHQDLGECILDSNDLERERGITILAKNISMPYKGVKINLIDTPGHADFGGEVERVLQMADGVLLLVDAAEGPMPQTRFVLKKAFGHHLRPLVVINKIDRPDRRLDEVVDEIGELFLELTEELGLDTVDDFEGKDVLDFPIVYASATGGYARLEPEDGNDNVTPLLEMMIDQIPPPHVEQDSPLQLQITTIDYNDYVGRIGIGRVTKGSIEVGDRIQLCGREDPREETVTELFIFDKLGRAPVEKVTAGDICAVTGIGNVEIGDTLTDPERPDPLPLIDIDLPTISMVFQVNDSPFAGQDGKFVTSRQLRQRLYKELESNVALRVEDLQEAGSFEVSGRGTLHLGILIENMRREDYEFQVGKPRPIFIEEDGKRKEPIELLHVQTPEESAGKVIELAGSRRGEMIRYDPQGERILVQFRIPARGLIGMGSRLMSLTAGAAIICHNFDGYEGHKGPIPGRAAGVMVSSERGQAIPYALFNLKDRGPMVVSPGEPVYEGMIVGEHCKDDDITVNLCREKKLTNVRASGSDKNILLSPPRLMSIEEALEYIEEDELLEITPKTTRLRKRLLNAKLRRKDQRD